jgi:hypothetical protein
MVREFVDVPRIRQEPNRRLMDTAAYRRRRLLEEFENKGGEIFSNDGVVANWEYLPYDECLIAAAA